MTHTEAFETSFKPTLKLPGSLGVDDVLPFPGIETLKLSRVNVCVLQIQIHMRLSRYGSHCNGPDSSSA